MFSAVCTLAVQSCIVVTRRLPSVLDGASYLLKHKAYTNTFGSASPWLLLSTEAQIMAPNMTYSFLFQTHGYACNLEWNADQWRLAAAAD